MAASSAGTYGSCAGVVCLLQPHARPAWFEHVRRSLLSRNRSRMELFPLTTRPDCKAKGALQNVKYYLILHVKLALTSLYPTIRITDYGVHPPTNTPLRLYDLRTPQPCRWRLRRRPRHRELCQRPITLGIRDSCMARSFHSGAGPPARQSLRLAWNGRHWCAVLH